MSVKRGADALSEYLRWRPLDSATTLLTEIQSLGRNTNEFEGWWIQNRPGKQRKIGC